ncbi:MAG: hypothetical protein RLZZ563_1122, partial [Pseudomonadota bacterium]
MLSGVQPRAEVLRLAFRAEEGTLADDGHEEPESIGHRPNHWGLPEYLEVSPTDEHPVVWVDWFSARALP